MKVPLFLVLMSSLLPSFARGTDEAYPRTAPGVCEVKVLPAARLMLTDSVEGYFSSNNKMFGKLFRYIRTNDLPMTAPVEARIQPGVMVFYMDPVSSVRTDLQPNAEVKFQDVSERFVASVGIRGSYSEENYAEGLAKLQGWLLTQKEYEAMGEPYAVYWNSPFAPFFFKQSEVHIPLRKK